MRTVILGLVVLGLSACVGPVAAGPPLPVRESDTFDRQPAGPSAQGGPLTTQDIMTTILAGKADLAECFKAEQAVAPYSSGKLLMVWDILPGGEPANIGVRRREDAALELSHCVARFLAARRFRPSADGARNIVFPFKY